MSYRGVLFAVLAALSLCALLRLWPLVLLVITAFIFMAALLPYMERLVRHSIPRVAAVLLLVLAVVAVIAGAFAIVVPAMLDEFKFTPRHLLLEATSAT